MTGYRFEPLQGLPRLGPAPLRPRDSRFAPAPAELCQLAGVWKGQGLGPDWVCEPKHDGIRLLWIGGQMVTREGTPFTAAEHLRPEFERLERRCGMPMFFDSEWVAGSFLDTLAAFRRGHGNGRAHVFDAMSLDDWCRDRQHFELWERRPYLDYAFEDWEPTGVRLVEQWPVRSMAAFKAHLHEIWATGGEGLMLKRRSSPYTRARSNDWLKAKRKLKLEATILERISEAALRIEYQGRKLRIAISPAIRGETLSVGMTVSVTAMEWTPTGQLRNGIAVAMGDTT